MTDQEILDNAPEGATHYQVSSGSYYMIDGWRMHVWLGEVWSVPISNELDVLLVGDVRPIADIRELVELRAEVAEKGKRIAELEHNQATRDIEQKLDAINYIISHESAKCKSKCGVDCNAIHLADLHNYAVYLEQELREQVKGGDV
jgi:hypothetical protein